jgi:hypothetical protein
MLSLAHQEIVCAKFIKISSVVLQLKRSLGTINEIEQIIDDVNIIITCSWSDYRRGWDDNWIY